MVAWKGLGFKVGSRDQKIPFEIRNLLSLRKYFKNHSVSFDFGHRGFILYVLVYSQLQFSHCIPQSGPKNSSNPFFNIFFTFSFQKWLSISTFNLYVGTLPLTMHSLSVLFNRLNCHMCQIPYFHTYFYMGKIISISKTEFFDLRRRFKDDIKSLWFIKWGH